MDPLSIAASIAGLVALPGSLVPLLTGAHGAKEEAQNLINELKALQLNLDQLDAYLQYRTTGTGSFKQRSLLVAQTASLTHNLSELKQRLRRTSKSTARRLVWPLQQNDYQYHMNQIRAFSQLIHFALSIDTSALLSSTTDEIAGKLSKQMQDLQVLEGIPSQIATLGDVMNDQTTALEDIRMDNRRAALLEWSPSRSIMIVSEEHVQKERVNGY